MYEPNDKYSALLTSGYTAGQNVLYVSAVPDNVPTLVVAAKGTDNETVFSVTGKTTNSLTGVTRVRGANVNLDAQTPLTCLNNEEFIQQLIDAITPEHNEDGTHKANKVIPASYLSTDGTLAGDSDTNIPTEKAVKAYADTKSDASKTETLTNKTINGDDNTLLDIPIDKLKIDSEAQGDILYRGASAWSRLAIGASGLFLKSQGAGQNPIWGSALTSKVIVITKDMSDTSNFSVTGVGFQPTCVVCFGVEGTDTDSASFAFVDSSGIARGIRYQSGATWSTNVSVISIRDTAGTIFNADFVSFDSDGITMSISKLGSPSGTLTACFLFLR